jgi:hypothetical protein
MPLQIPFPAFVVQSNGIVIISDGATEIAYSSIAEFKIDEPGFALPNGIGSINYEKKRGQIFATGVTGDGQAAMELSPRDSKTNLQEEVALYEGYIANVATYQAAISERAGAYYGVTSVAAAQEIALADLVAEFEARASALVARKWGPLERETFTTQLAEAEAWTADNAAPTPFLDGIVAVEGGTIVNLVAAILGNSAALKTASAALLGAKRKHGAAIDALADVAAVKAYDVTAGWPPVTVGA